MCTAENLSSSLQAFPACHLIPLDKNPGLIPIGVGEMLPRKVIVTHVRDHIVASVGSLQVYKSCEAGCGSLIDAMSTVYEELAVLFVDASNAFKDKIKAYFY